MTSFVALYRGQTVASARLIGVTANPALVAVVSAQLLAEIEPDIDEIEKEMNKGKRNALQLILRETKETKGT